MKELMQKIINPRNVALVTCSENINIFGKDMDKDNITPVAWHMPISYDGFYAIALQVNHFSTEIIKKSNVFCVNFVPYTYSEDVLICGSNTGRHNDKFALTSFSKEECLRIDCVRIKEAISYLECEVVKEDMYADHIIFIGKVVGGEKFRDVKQLIYKGDKCFIDYNS